ncbi:hypothetical protein D3C80_1587640 [compost metagenome]
MSQHFILAAVHERRDLRVLFAQLIGDQPPLLMALGTAVLGEDRAQQRRYHGALTFADVGHGIAHEMHTAALPGRVQYLGNSRLEPFVGVGDDQLHAPQATPHEAAQEVCPERLSL